MEREEMWKEFENQLKREVHTPMTMSYDDSVRCAELGIEEVVAKWKERLEQKPCDCISREEALKALGEAPYVWTDCDAELQAYEDWRTIKEMLEGLPSVTPKELKTGWNNHQIACMLADLFGDTCACNYNGNDEWLSELCDFKDTCCPNPVGVACWEQFLKHSQSRYTECGCEVKDKNSLPKPYRESEG